MTSLHRVLACDVLAAAMPSRGVLLVTPADDDPAHLARFAALARRHYDDGGGRAISPAVMLVADGRVRGLLRGDSEARPGLLRRPLRK